MKLDLDDARRFVRESARHADANPATPLPPDAWFAALDPAAQYVETTRARARAVLACDATHDAWGAWLELTGRGGSGGQYRAVLLKPEAPRAALVNVARAVARALDRAALDALVHVKGAPVFGAWRAAKDGDAPPTGRPLGSCPTGGQRGALLERWRLHGGATLVDWCDRLGCAVATYKRYLESEAALPARAARLLALWAADAPRLAARTRKAPALPPPPRDVDPGDVSIAELQLLAALNDLLARAAANVVIPAGPGPSNPGTDVRLDWGADEEDA